MAAANKVNWESLSFFYADHREVDLPDQHRFPMQKYRLLREALSAKGVMRAEQLHPADFISQDDLRFAHTDHYIRGLFHNTLTPNELRPIGLPWSQQLLDRSLASAGGFLQAAERALVDGFSALLAGGTHHAHAGHGEGFCVFNDFAVAALKLLHQERVEKVLILDLDVHQGNGNSSILNHRSDVFICSFHGEKNYPYRKVASHLDVPLPAGTGDEDYLAKLSEVLPTLPRASVLFYQAGVDVLAQDTLGTFKLSHQGVRARDEMVFRWAKERGLPVAMGIGGGYAKPIELTVEAHVNTFRAARSIFSD